MDDRELLELAAKVAEIEHGADRLDCGLSITLPDGRHDSLPQWNPLHDDGDALRLAVRLRIPIRFDVDCIDHCDRTVAGNVCETWSDELGENSDPYAATRRAIVRAAAALAARGKPAPRCTCLTGQLGPDYCEVHAP